MSEEENHSARGGESGNRVAEIASEEKAVNTTESTQSNYADDDSTSHDAENHDLGESHAQEAGKASAQTENTEPADISLEEKLRRAERLSRLEQQKREALEQALNRYQNNGDSGQSLPPSRLNPEDFNNSHDYMEARSHEIAQARQQMQSKRSQQQAVQQRLSNIESNWQNQMVNEASKYPDFDKVALNQQMPLSKAGELAIKSSPKGADVAYYLGKNLKEADRISRLTPLETAREIGKIEAMLASQSKKVTNAPNPISPVKSNKAAPTKSDVSKMNLAQFRKYRGVS